jgi:hypothetical protein
MHKIPYLLNCWSNEAVYVTDGKLGEFSNFLVFNSREESHLNSSRFNFSLVTAVCPELQFFIKPVAVQKVVEPEPLIG